MKHSTSRQTEPGYARKKPSCQHIFLLLVVLFLLCGCYVEPIAQGAHTVILKADGTEKQIQSESETVLDFLVEQNITLSESDRVSPPETARLVDLMTVEVIRVVYQMETMTETVPYERKVVRDATIDEDESRLIQSGSPGLREMQYRLTLENGEEVDRILLSDTFVTVPQDEIRVIGTKTELETVYITGTLAYLNRQDAWVIRGNNLERRRLTSTGDLDGRVFALSPDSDYLMFTRTVTESSGLNDLWMVRTTEANPNAIPLSVKDVLWADWSPEDRSIAWTTAEPSDRPPGWRGENDLWTAIVSNQNILISRKKILEPDIGTGYGWWGTRYVWSPQGDRLAFSLPQSIGFIDLDKTEKVTLQTFAAYKTYSSWAWNPAITWSRDGLFIISVVHDKAPGGGDAEESPVFDVRMLDVTGVYSAEIASETGMWATPKVSPDGGTLLFGRALIPFQSATSRYRLCTVDLDGSNQLCPYPQSDETGIEIPLWQWSPDGEAIAFIENGDVVILNTGEWTSTSLTDEGQITQFDWN